MHECRKTGKRTRKRKQKQKKHKQQQLAGSRQNEAPELEVWLEQTGNQEGKTWGQADQVKEEEEQSGQDWDDKTGKWWISAESLGGEAWASLPGRGAGFREESPTGHPCFQHK